MKKAKIIIEVEQEKLEALNTFSDSNGQSIEEVLQDAFIKIYEKNVPTPVRTFIERNISGKKTKKKPIKSPDSRFPTSTDPVQRE